eukprot:CAMPEP_0115540380 /NCGR_PEP_ID=MMETSP0271-20121206/89896_1 /TAXON_ID=71861 /ORGANISM="Scrippsiella trochoidea, Strain CCMP3099" /LENGTH=228 /DNA_ID=CAMNT_0002973369 /DNA_START=279 /DNA_END=968 /DNA_ORIENTATION=+
MTFMRQIVTVAKFGLGDVHVVVCIEVMKQSEAIILGSHGATTSLQENQGTDFVGGAFKRMFLCMTENRSAKASHACRSPPDTDILTASNDSKPLFAGKPEPDRKVQAKRLWAIRDAVIGQLQCRHRVPNIALDSVKSQHQRDGCTSRDRASFIQWPINLAAFARYQHALVGGYRAVPLNHADNVTHHHCVAHCVNQLESQGGPGLTCESEVLDASRNSDQRAWSVRVH